MLVGMELLERNRSHGEMGKGMMGDCVGCPDHDRLGMMVGVGVTHGDRFGGGGYDGLDKGYGVGLGVSKNGVQMDFQWKS